MARRQGRRGWGKVRRLPSGKYQASYIGNDAMRHTAPRTFTAKTDAEHWLADERRSIERDEWIPPAMRVAEAKAKAVTLGEYAVRWIEHRNIKPRTRIQYEALYERHIKRPLGKVPLKNVTPETVRAWYAGLGSEATRRNSHAYGLLHAICGTAVADSLIVANPCQIPRVMNPPRKREPVILDVAEVGQLADAIEPERFKALILVSAWCGLRWGEVIELQRRDISKGCDVIVVSRGATHRKGCRIDTPKSGKGRAVVVPPHIREDLKHHLKTYVAKDADALLFPPARSGCHLNDRVFREYFTEALKAIGREGVRVHDLRHFAGTQTARVGNLVETMGRLGHSTPKASLLYQQIVGGRDAEIAEALSKLAAAD
jgi:integrase